MLLRTAGGALAAALLIVSSARAQAPQPAAGAPPIQLTPQGVAPGSTADDGSTVVEALEVVARPLGPALWRVKRGDAEVVIVGGYSPLPHSLDWNKARLDRALSGAQAFYEPKASLGVFDMAGLLFRQGEMKLGRGRTLDSVIGPARAARLREVAKTAHSDPAKMQPFKPAVAGLLSYQTFIRTVGWSAEKPGTTIRRMVREHHLPTRPLAKIGTRSVIDALLRSDTGSQVACFDAFLDETEWESAHGLDAARAWSEGRVTDLRRLRSTAILDRCLKDNGGARATLDKAVADTTASIEDILARPGKSVALIDMVVLLPKDGVLDRLKARGAEISLPPD